MRTVTTKDAGKISLLMRVMPEDIKTDLTELQGRVAKALPSDCKLEGTETKPFAFGLKALVCKITVPDVEGNADMIEETLRGVEGVQGVEFLKMSRIIG
ncbi:MAG: elongation factor 1-beta [Euryarchaeota archaeon]|nr:elongation factor 1-beta [Euryarchaeota archaeon]